MLMKHTQVSREGIVTDPPLAQLTYGALLSGRIAMVADSSNTAKKVRRLERPACAFENDSDRGFIVHRH